MADQYRQTQGQQRPANASQQAQSRPQGQGKPRDKVETIRTLCRKTMAPSLRTLLGSTADIERFAKVFLNAIESGQPDLIKCSEGSIARSMMHSAEVQLEVGGAYPFAYLIPYWNKDRNTHEAQFQISVWGYLELVRRSGGVKKVWADVVCEHDEYETISGTAGKSIVHRPDWFGGRDARGGVIGSYACALLDNGETVFEPVSRAELDAARAANRGQSPAWATWYDQQAMKVALKRLSKYLPKGTRPERALEIDEDPGTRPVLDVEGVEVQVPVDEVISQQQTAQQGEAQQGEGPEQTDTLKRAVAAAQAAAEAAARAGQRGASTTVDRDRLHLMLVDADERWRPLRARVEGWAEGDALAALSFLRTVMSSGYDVDGEPPVLPDCMRFERDVA